jgi:hypothetical protein
MHSTYAGRAVSVVIFLPLLFLPVVVTGQTTVQQIPLKNWAAPLYWQPNQAERQTAGRAAPGIRPLVTQISTNPLTFVAIAPCRLVDTRGTAAGFIGPTPFSGPSLVASSTTTFPVQSAAEATTTAPTPCGTIPSTAQAYSFNITVVPKTAGGVDFITVWPAGSAQPAVSTLNDGQNAILANAAVVPAGTPSGGVNVINSGPATTDLIIDMNGYYAATGENGGGGSITSVTAGTDLTGGGNSGTVTLSLDTTKVPTLAGSNSFTGSNTFASAVSAGSVSTGSASVTGALSAGSLNTGSIASTGSITMTSANVNTTGALTAAGNITTTSGIISSSSNIYLNGNIVDNGYIIYQQPFSELTNTALGVNSGGGSDSSGTGNTASGYGAMGGNGSGSSDALAARLIPHTPRAKGSGNNAHPDTSSGPSGSFNTAHGYQALSSLSSGRQNTAHGAMALSSLTTAYNNTAIGLIALGFTTTGEENTAAGSFALALNTTGSYNTATGDGALLANTTGIENTATGEGALGDNTTGNDNTAVGVGALEVNTTGSNNIAVGYNAAANVSGGNSNNIHIGSVGASADNGVIRIGGNTALGDPATQTAFYASGIGNATVSGVPVLVNTSTGQLGVATSSRRFKEDIHDMADASDGLMRLRPVTFRYKQPFDDGTKPIQYGLIAEEVAEVYPDLVARSADGQIETVKYQVLDPMLLNEVQKQNQRAQRQDETIRQQRDQVSQQQEQIRKLEARLSALEGVLSGKAASAATAGR